MRRRDFFATVLAAHASVGAAAPKTLPILRGYASWYSTAESKKPMANGKPLDDDALTCAAWGWPFGCNLRVTSGSKSVIVTVTDRGPAWRLYAEGRVIDLTRAAFSTLAPLNGGLVEVEVTKA